MRNLCITKSVWPSPSVMIAIMDRQMLCGLLAMILVAAMVATADGARVEDPEMRGRI